MLTEGGIAEPAVPRHAADRTPNGRLRPRSRSSAAVTSMQAASDLGVTRFVIVSSIGTHDVAGAAAAMRPYLQAKRDADDALKQSGLDWTIVKPGHLTDAPGSGCVQVSRTFGRRA